MPCEEKHFSLRCISWTLAPMAWVHLGFILIASFDLNQPDFQVLQLWPNPKSSLLYSASWLTQLRKPGVNTTPLYLSEPFLRGGWGGTQDKLLSKELKFVSVVLLRLALTGHVTLHVSTPPCALCVYVACSYEASVWASQNPFWKASHHTDFSLGQFAFSLFLSPLPLPKRNTFPGLWQPSLDPEDRLVSI